MDDFLDVLLGDRVKTNNAASERLVELEVLLLRIFHPQRDETSSVL